MWTHQYESLTEEEIERLNREGVRIPIEIILSAGLPNYQKIERYLQWKELKKVVIQSKHSLKEYEAILDHWELTEFEEKYKKDRNK